MGGAVSSVRWRGALEGHVKELSPFEATDAELGKLPGMATGGNGYVRVGHKGAAALAPANTIESLAAALAHGVDMVEFDVVDAPDGRLVLAHSREEIGPGAVDLDDALAFLASQAPMSTGIDLDLKCHGFEAQVVEALVRHDCVGRTIRALVFSRQPEGAPPARTRAPDRHLVPVGSAGNL